MGNKTGKFNVPATEKANKDEQVVNDTEIKVDTTNGIEQNGGDHPKLECNSVEKTDAAPEVKKKSIVSWFKKVSMRKEKKPKAPRENGVKEEVVDTPKENGVVEELNEIVKENVNGDVKSEKVELNEPESRDLVTQEVNEVEPVDESTVTTEHKDETITPIANEHDNTEVTETAAEEQ